MNENIYQKELDGAWIGDAFADVVVPKVPESDHPIRVIFPWFEHYTELKLCHEDATSLALALLEAAQVAKEVTA